MEGSCILPSMSPPGILHVDLDAFFAAVEQRDAPALRGKPVVVGGASRRGVVAAASYEARDYGLHSAMPMVEALRLCPHAIVVPHHFERYREASDHFFEILGRFSPLVESLSLDEAFLDVTQSRQLFGDGETIAGEIKKMVAEELALVASVGVAPTKFVAKIASDIDKPDGLRVVPTDGVLQFLHPLPLSRLWGVGRVTQERLRRIGLETIGDVARYPEGSLRKRLGDKLGSHLVELSRGIDPREVVSEHATKSIGHEETFETDRTSASQLEPTIVEQADRVASRLRRAQLRARTVTLKIKFADFRTVTRRRTLAAPTSDGLLIARAAKELLDAITVSGERGKKERVRLCGVSTSGLEDRSAPRQLLFDEAERVRGERLGDTLDAIAERYGMAAVKRAAATKDE